MKGFKDSKKKFHPINQKRGVRKPRDQKAKTQGIRFRRTNTDREIEKARKLGVKAYEEGRSNIPASDKELMKLLKGRKVGDSLTIPQLKAFTEGWWDADRELESYEKKIALDFIKKHPDATMDNLSESTDIRDPDRTLALLELYGKVTKTDEEFPKYRIKEDKEENNIPDPDPHEYGQTILDQLSASRINGFPFFKYTGIKDFVLFGEDTVMFNKIPKNPNNIERIQIKYDIGDDLYNMHFYKKGDVTPSDILNGIFFDQMADIIVDRMGVR